MMIGVRVKEVTNVKILCEGSSKCEDECVRGLASVNTSV